MAPRIAPWPRGCMRCMRFLGPDDFPLGKAGRFHERVCWSCKETQAWGMMCGIERELRRKRDTWTEPDGTKVRRCCECGTVEPIDNYARNRVRGRVAVFSTCRACLRAKKTAYHRTRMDGPNGRELRAAKAARLRERRREDPARFSANQKRYYEKLKRDKEAWTRHLEIRRMNARLRAERSGREMTRKVRATMLPQVRTTLPVAPLLDVIREYAQRNGVSERAFADAIAVSMRQYRGWCEGEYDRVQFDVADRICTKLGLNMFEVWAELGQEAA